MNINTVSEITVKVLKAGEVMEITMPVAGFNDNVAWLKLDGFKVLDILFQNIGVSPCKMSPLSYRVQIVKEKDKEMNVELIEEIQECDCGETTNLEEMFGKFWCETCIQSHFPL